jgi:transposase InsO family protein
MLLRLAYLGITNAFAVLRQLPGGGRDKDIEILSLRHQLAVLQRQLASKQIRFEPVDRAWLAALLHPLPRPTLRRLRLLVQPDTVLSWHRDLLARRHAAVSRPRRRGRPRTLRSIRAVVLRLARDNPAPDRAVTAWTDFLRSHADALLAADFIGTVTLTGARIYILAVIEHASRRIRVLGVTAHPAASWVSQAARNLVMDLDEEGCCKAKFLIRDRDGKYPGIFNAILADAGIEVVLSGIQMPRMDAIMERWVRTCRRELLDRTLIRNQRHLLHALRECERFYNRHRPHQGIANARPLKPLPEPITVPDQLTRLNIHRRDRLGGVLHEYKHAA